MKFDRIYPTEKGQWLNKTNNDFYDNPVLISKEVKNKGIGDATAIFDLFSLGVITSRDDWAYDRDPEQLSKKVKTLISVYDKERVKYKGRDDQDPEMRKELDYSIKWSRDLIQSMVKGREIVFDDTNIRESLYRPFCKKNVYFSEKMCGVLYQNPKLYPTGKQGENLCLSLLNSTHVPFSVMSSQHILDLNGNGRPTTQVPIYHYPKIRESLYRPFCKKNVYFSERVCERLYQNPKLYPTGKQGENLCLSIMQGLQLPFSVTSSQYTSDLPQNGRPTTQVPIYHYKEPERQSNITDWGLQIFKDRYAKDIPAEDIFAYCYAVLSDPGYQKKYKENLKIDYPRVPLYEDFEFYKSIGEELIRLHAFYEDVPHYDGLSISRNDEYIVKGIENPNKNKVSHPMRLDKKNGIIILDKENRIEGIPLEAFEYKIGHRSALDWVVEGHKFKKLNPDKELHHKTLIDNDLDMYNWIEIRSYLFDLIPRIVKISLDTITIYDKLITSPLTKSF